MKKALAIILITIIVFSFAGCSLIQTTLDTPTNVRIKGNALVWSSVDGASSYVVMVDYDEYTTSQTTFDLTTADVEVGQEYSVMVKAKGDGFLKLSSEFSSPIKWVATESSGGSDDDDDSYTPPENLGDVNDQSLVDNLFNLGLGYGVNALTAQSAIESRPLFIFREDAFDKTDVGSYKSGSTRANATSEEDISSIANSYNSKLVFGTEVEVSYAGLFTTGFKSKFSTGESVKNSLKQNQFYYIINHYYTDSCYQIKGYQRAEDFQGRLDDDFISDLEKVQNGDKSPETFFRDYGTHLKMAVSYGGMLEVYHSTFSSEEINTTELSNALSMALSASLNVGLSGGSVGVETSFDEEHMKEFTKGEQKSNLSIKAIGGDPGTLNGSSFSALSSSYAAWVESLGNGDNYAITDVADGGLVPIWKYIPEEYEEAKAILIEYFEQQAKVKEDSLAAEMEYVDYGDTVNFAGGHGTEESPYLIATAQQLRNINNGLDKHYKLMNDIDISGVDWQPLGYVDGEYRNFSGELDGDGHSIIGLYKRNTPAMVGVDAYMGLFAILDGAKVTHLKLENVDFCFGNTYKNPSYVYVGALAGRANNSEIDRVSVSGKLQGGWANDCAQEEYIGGLLGSANSTTIKYCSNKAMILGYHYLIWAGGIVGFVQDPHVKILYCYNTGYIEIAHNGNGVSGGIVGLVNGSTATVRVTGCYAYCQIKNACGGWNDNIGGIVATATAEGNKSTVTDNYYCVQGLQSFSGNFTTVEREIWNVNKAGNRVDASTMLSGYQIGVLQAYSESNFSISEGCCWVYEQGQPPKLYWEVE